MTKRKSKTSAFKAPHRAQTRAKRQKTTEETKQQQTVEENQTAQSENNDFHNAPGSQKLDEHQPSLQISQTAEIPVDRCISLEEKTSNDDNEEEKNSSNAHDVSEETEENIVTTLKTTEMSHNEECVQSKPVKGDSVNQPDAQFDDKQSENIINSDQKLEDDAELQSNECQIESKSSHEDDKTEVSEHLKSSGNASQSLEDQTGAQMSESADPLVKRRVRRRMGMRWMGERKRTVTGRGNGSVFNEELVIMSEDLMKSCSIFPSEDGNGELEISAPCFSASCPLEETTVWEQEKANRDRFRAQISAKWREITCEIKNERLSCANADDIKLPERNEAGCMEENADERSIKEDEMLLKSEICEKVSEIATKGSADLVEEPISAVVMQDLTKIPNEAETSTKPLEEKPKVGDSEIEQSSTRECDSIINNHSIEKSAEPVNALSVIQEREEKCDSSEFSLVSAENTVNGEDDRMSLFLSAALPRGDDGDLQVAETEPDLQLFAEQDGLKSEAVAARADPPSPLSVHSVTDSQLNDISLSLEDLPLSEAPCDLEDASDLVCGLISALSSLNHTMRDAHRRIGYGQRGRNPLRPMRRYSYGPAHSGL